MKKYAPEKMELGPRDLVSRSITQEILEGRGVGPDKDAVYLDLTHLGKEKIMERLPELRDLALTFLGLDMIKEPIMIASTAHYSMGGIPVTLAGNVKKSPTETVKGFYAAGECSCVSVHGANRLGANSVLEAMLFGRHVGKTISDELDSLTLEPVKSEDADNFVKEVDWILNNNGDEKVPQLRKELQEGMTNNAGVFRTEESLKKQKEIIKDLRARFKNIRIDDKSKVYNTDLQEALELGHMLDFSLFIVEGALARKESRGAHFRNDYPKRDDKKFLKHTYAYMSKRGAIKLEYGDVVLGKFEPQERIY
jgi:succinate dehydrogenase / fumarate reductase flavoprotein subunit